MGCVAQWSHTWFPWNISQNKGLLMTVLCNLKFTQLNKDTKCHIFIIFNCFGRNYISAGNFVNRDQQRNAWNWHCIFFRFFAWLNEENAQLYYHITKNTDLHCNLFHKSLHYPFQTPGTKCITFLKFKNTLLLHDKVTIV